MSKYALPFWEKRRSTPYNTALPLRTSVQKPSGEGKCKQSSSEHRAAPPHKQVRPGALHGLRGAVSDQCSKGEGILPGQGLL